jgi:hypothetical protein
VLKRGVAAADTARMELQTIRSWRDPGFWIPVACAVLVIAALAALCDLETRHYLAGLQAQAAANPQEAASAAEHGLLWIGRFVSGFALAASTLLARCFQLALREQRLPPSGWWSLGALRAVVGPDARTLSAFGLFVSTLLAGAGVGCLLVIQHLIDVL